MRFISKNNAVSEITKDKSQIASHLARLRPPPRASLLRRHQLDAPATFQRPREQQRHCVLYHKDSSVIRLHPTHPNHVWAIDFVHDKLSNGRSYKMLTVLDEYTRQALCVDVKDKMGSNDVLEVMHNLLMKHGKPDYIRSDNGGEFVAEHLQNWLSKVGIQPIHIYPSSPWENGYNERFNGILRQEVLNAEWFHSIKQAQVAINVWLREYNYIRPHHAIGMRPPCQKPY